MPLFAASTATTAAPTARLAQLDAMRGIAAVLVVAFHFTSRYPELFPESAETGLRFAIGSYGVDFFFILSGFVIFLSLDNCRGPGQFAWLRFWRLFPVYWAAVLVTAGVIWFAGAPGQGDDLTLSVVVANLTMVHQFLYVPNVDGVYWTLAYEFAFYCWAAVLYFVLPRRFIELAAMTYVMAAFAVTGLANVTGMQIPYVLKMGLMLDYIQLFVAGVVLYHVRSDGLTPARVGMLLLLTLVQGYMHGLTAALMTVIVLVSILAVLRGGLLWLTSAPMLFLGTISYSLYLVHQAIGYAIKYRLIESGLAPGLAILVAVAATVALATLLTYGIERPVLDVVRSRRRRVATQ